MSNVRMDFFFSSCISVHVCNWFVCLCNFLLPWLYNLDSIGRANSSGNNRNEIYTFDAFLREIVMTEDRISELRALCAEYEQKKATCEAAGLKNKAADIAADGVGRKALEALTDLLDELESLDRQVQTLCNWISDAMKSPEILVLSKHTVKNFPSPESLKKMTKERIYECQS